MLESLQELYLCMTQLSQSLGLPVLRIDKQLRQQLEKRHRKIEKFYEKQSQKHFYVQLVEWVYIHPQARLHFTKGTEQLQQLQKRQYEQDIGLMQAIREQNLEMLRQSLENGADPNHRTLADERLMLSGKPFQIQRNSTPLHYCSLFGNVEMAKLLMKHHASVNAENIWYRTPLYYAAGKNHMEMCILLLDHGASVNLKEISGWTPLHWAAANNFVEICELLLERGADRMDNTKSAIS